MVGSNYVINKALMCPSLSPDREKPSHLFKSSSDQYFHPAPITPDVAAHGKKRPPPTSPIYTSQHEPQTRRQRTGKAEGSSSGSAGVRMDDVIVKVEELVKMLKRVSDNKNLVSDPLLACFVSAQTVLMACTAELMFRSTSKGSNHRSSSTNEGDQKMKKSKSAN